MSELETLCAAQQGSLEEGEERFRSLSDSHDALRHANLQAKAQLVTAQAQVGPGGKPTSSQLVVSWASAPMSEWLPQCKMASAGALRPTRAHMHTLDPPRPSPIEQVSELRTARDELAAEAALLKKQLTASKTELAARTQR